MKVIDPAALPPERKAQLIYQQVRSDMAERLWQAALGNAEARRDQASGVSGDANGFLQQMAPQQGQGSAGSDLDRLLALLVGNEDKTARQPDPTDTAAAAAAGKKRQPVRGEPAVGQVETAVGAGAAEPLAAVVKSEGRGQLSLGANAMWQGALESAAKRTGLPVPALAAIVDAEAGKNSKGQWVTWSRNPRSSAAGLGQFLAGTWVHEAERPGTWLNATARANGWLNESGRVLGSAKGKLLALRYDGEASINATADYARTNLQRMQKAGISPGDSVGKIAHAAYLGHHLGIGDATRFLRGGLPESRARQLLIAQVGSERASRDIARAGEAALAHRQWLTGYLDRKVRPDRFVV